MHGLIRASVAKKLIYGFLTQSECVNCVTSFENHITLVKAKRRNFISIYLKKKIYLKIFIRYMVSIRCKMVVKEELKKLGLHYIVVELGEAEIMESLSREQHDKFRDALFTSGLELMDDKRSVLMEKIKNVIIELTHYSEEPLEVKFSEYLSQKLNHDYGYLANLFTENQGTTIEKFYIAHKIERVKELLVYNELNLTEIAYQMHYSSVAHLSAQFKKVTGLTPSHFKQLREKRRSMLEDV